VAGWQKGVSACAAEGWHLVTPLHCAASEEVAQELIAGGASLDAVDRAGNTPLHVAAQRGLPRVVACLLSQPGDGRSGGGGESFPRVYWVAVPKASRARRVNRRRRTAAARGSQRLGRHRAALRCGAGRRGDAGAAAAHGDRRGSRRRRRRR
jgi:ankyrin repeat protein